MSEIWRLSSETATAQDYAAAAEYLHDAMLVSMLADLTGCGAHPEKAGNPPPGIPLWDEARHAALAEMSGPMTLPEAKLPSYDAVPPGCCAGCHLPVPAGQATCTYCDLAKQASVSASRAVANKLENRRRTCEHDGCVTLDRGRYPRSRPRDVTLRAVLVLAGTWAVVAGGTYASWLLILAGAILVFLGVTGVRP